AVAVVVVVVVVMVAVKPHSVGVFPGGTRGSPSFATKGEPDDGNGSNPSARGTRPLDFLLTFLAKPSSAPTRKKRKSLNGRGGKPSVKRNAITGEASWKNSTAWPTPGTATTVIFCADCLVSLER